MAFVGAIGVGNKAQAKSRVVRYDKPTRDPNPTYIDPSDPKAKQTAIHTAPKSFADYMAERARKEGGGASTPAYSPPAASAPKPAAPKPSSGGAMSPYEEYMAKRGGRSSAPSYSAPAASAPAPPKPAASSGAMSPYEEYMAKRGMSSPAAPAARSAPIPSVNKAPVESSSNEGPASTESYLASLSKRGSSSYRSSSGLPYAPPANGNGSSSSNGASAPKAAASGGSLFEQYMRERAMKGR